MRHALRGSLSLALLVACLFVVPDGRAGEELDRYEDQAVSRCAEKALKTGKNERAHWIKELEAAFPDKVTHATTEDEYATWFVLLAGKNEEWRRDDSSAVAITELFDKVIAKLELGPVPSIKRDEFMRYAKRLMRDNPQPGEKTDPHEDADKVFRALDRDGDSELARDEYTAGLKDEKLRADADGNGRITKDEYRGYFARKVATKADTLSAAAKAGGDARGPDGKLIGKPRPGAGLPEWFTTLDGDKDGQIALFEWRKSGRMIVLYTEMDLNADGLLTRDEYQRFVKMNELKEAERRREEEERNKEK